MAVASNITADQQNTAATAVSGVPSTDPNAPGGIIANAQNTSTVSPPFSPSQVTAPTQVGVAANQTVQGQMSSMANPNSPYFQQWATAGAENAASRGFSGNSSIEQSGILNSVMQNATPIATADANTYNNAALTNASASNNFNLSNLSGNTQRYATDTGANTARQQIVSTAQNSAASNATALAQSGISAAASKYSADTGAATAAMTAQTNATVQQAHDANSALIASNGQAQSSYNSYVAAVAQINQNDKMDASAKATAIDTQTQIFNNAMSGLRAGNSKVSDLSSPLQTAAVTAAGGVNVSNMLQYNWGGNEG